MKPSIRRHRTDSGDLGHGWDLTRPPFGFATEPAVSNHPSWKDARAALLSSGVASAPSSKDRSGFYDLGLKSWSGQRSRRPRWIEATEWRVR